MFFNLINPSTLNNENIWKDLFNIELVNMHIW